MAPPRRDDFKWDYTQTHTLNSTLHVIIYIFITVYSGKILGITWILTSHYSSKKFFLNQFQKMRSRIDWLQPDQDRKISRNSEPDWINLRNPPLGPVKNRNLGLQDSGRTMIRQNFILKPRIMWFVDPYLRFWSKLLKKSKSEIHFFIF